MHLASYPGRSLIFLVKNNLKASETDKRVTQFEAVRFTWFTLQKRELLVIKKKKFHGRRDGKTDKVGGVGS